VTQEKGRCSTTIAVSELHCTQYTPSTHGTRQGFELAQTRLETDDVDDDTLILVLSKMYKLGSRDSSP
jgi:hypothetical protein